MAYPRLHISFASGSSVAAVLLRGPSDWFCLARWDTAVDEVELGAWFHGMIYSDRCSISPNGKLFSYLAAKHGGNFGGDECNAWIAISRPPWLTAIGFWPAYGTQGYSTDFLHNSSVLVTHPHWEELLTDRELPASFEIVSNYSGRGAPEQDAPPLCKSSAFYRDNHGVDQHGRSFDYFDGKLRRESIVFADFANIKPDPQPAPDWARRWPTV